ncbi:MAG: hypothetical protein Q4C30_06765 [Bacteroidia bacterium]|nr:hypothetical protein [Bacteroidia bacterium]
MRRYNLYKGIGTMAVLGIASSCANIGMGNHAACGDDLYYNPSDVNSQASQQVASSSKSNTSTQPISYITEADEAAYDERVKGYRSAGVVTEEEDKRDFSQMQEYYSNASNLQGVEYVNDTLYINYEDLPEADGVWIGGFNGSASDQSYAERLIKFHGPMSTIPYYSHVYDAALYSGDWNIYVDKWGSTYLVPRWNNPLYSNYYYGSPFYGWDWGWHGWGYHNRWHFGLHNSWYFDWGYLGYGFGWCDPYYGWYSPWHGYHHGYHGWYDHYYHDYWHHGYHGHSHINNNHTSHNRYYNGHRPSSSVGRGGHRGQGGGYVSERPNRGNGGKNHVGAGTRVDKNTTVRPNNTPSQYQGSPKPETYTRSYTRPARGNGNTYTGGVSKSSSSSSSSGYSQQNVERQRQTTRSSSRNAGSSNSGSSSSYNQRRANGSSYSSGSSNKSSSTGGSSRNYTPSRSSGTNYSRPSSSSSGGYRSSGSSFSGGGRSSGGSYSGGHSSGGRSGGSSGGGRTGGGRR